MGINTHRLISIDHNKKLAIQKLLVFYEKRPPLVISEVTVRIRSYKKWIM